MTIEIREMDAASAPAIERLLDLAFGPGRHGRTAYRLREGQHPIAALSMTAFRNGVLAGSLQCWALALELADEPARMLAMVGPLAVDPTLQGAGVGKAMLAEAGVRLDRTGLSAMLIGDEPYYGAFGFRAGPASGWTLPGPAEPHRILLRAARDTLWPPTGSLVSAPLPSPGRAPS